MRLASACSRPTISQSITQSKPIPPSSAKAERHPTTTIRKVSGGAKSAGPTVLPKATTARPNALRLADNQGVAAETDVPYDGPSPAPSAIRVRSNAGNEKTNTVATWTIAQLVASSARTLFVPIRSDHAVTNTDDRAYNKKKLPLTSPYCAGLKCNYLMMDIAARPSTALSAKLINPRPSSIEIITHPYAEMCARAEFTVYSFCFCDRHP
jgi:hypothetical protein